MLTKSFRLLLVVGLSSMGACGNRPTAAAPGTTGAPEPAIRRDPNVITEQEMSDPSVASGDALSAVRKLRPNFLQTRGTGSIQNKNAGSIHVSINNGPLLTLSDLSGMRATDVKEVRYISASDATQRFGTAAGTGGVLLVKTR
jgi:hypothetical protein